MNFRAFFMCVLALLGFGFAVCMAVSLSTDVWITYDGTNHSRGLVHMCAPQCVRIDRTNTENVIFYTQILATAMTGVYAFVVTHNMLAESTSHWWLYLRLFLAVSALACGMTAWLRMHTYHEPDKASHHMGYGYSAKVAGVGDFGVFLLALTEVVWTVQNWLQPDMGYGLISQA